MGDHHGGHPGPSCPHSGPAQGGPVGDLQAVGGERLQEPGDPPSVGEDAIAAGAGQQRAGQRDHPSLLGVAVTRALAGYDEDRFVAGRPVSGAQLPQCGAQPSGGGGDEVGEPYDAQTHAATSFRADSTSS